MMDRAKFSFAMENSNPKLKEKANFIANHHDEKGVIKAINDIINGKLSHNKSFNK